MPPSRFESDFAGSTLDMLQDMFGVPATYSHNGPAVSITVMPGEVSGLIEAEEGGQRAVWEGDVQIAATDVSTPAIGAFVTIGGDRYAITEIIALSDVMHTVRLTRETGSRMAVARQ